MSAKYLEQKWRGVGSLLSEFYNFVVKVPWVVAIVVIGIILFQGLTQSTTVIEPISVPKNLAEKGYTADIAARHLRDAIRDYLLKNRSTMKGPAFVMHGELPTVVVPTVGISLDAVVASFQTVLRSTRSKTISGEIIEEPAGYYRLQLRLDGRRLKLNDTNATKPDDLLIAAVPSILDEIQPYLVASAMYEEKNTDGALKKIDEIISRFQNTGDLNLAWAHNLRGIILYEEKCQKNNECNEALAAFKTALEIDRNVASAHVNLGILYKKLPTLGDAESEFRWAIRLNPTNPNAYYQLANVLPDEKQEEKQELLGKAQDAEKKLSNTSASVSMRGPSDVKKVIQSRDPTPILVFRPGLIVGADGEMEH